MCFYLIFEKKYIKKQNRTDTFLENESYDFSQNFSGICKNFLRVLFRAE